MHKIVSQLQKKLNIIKDPNLSFVRILQNLQSVETLYLPLLNCCLSEWKNFQEIHTTAIMKGAMVLGKIQM